MAQYHSEKERQELKKKFSIIAIVFVVVCGVLGILLQMIDNAEIRSAEESTTAQETVTIAGKDYVAKKGIKTVLILGNDNSENRDRTGNGQADTIELLVINSRTNTYNRVTINRNTMTDVDVLDNSDNIIATSESQICLAYAQGKDENSGAKNVAKSVSNLLYGQEITDYASINMDAIQTINQALGGVEVTIEDDFSRSDPTLIMGETLTLTDEQAEHFVHDRQNVADGTNENRVKRQNSYLSGAKIKLIEKCKENSSFALDFYESLEVYMVTSMNAKRFAKLVNDLIMYEDGGRREVEGSAVIGANNYEEFTVDQDNLDELVTTLFYEEVED